MPDNPEPEAEGKKVGESRGSLIPTGSYLTSEGSSVELDSDLATAEEIPTTEEILRKGKKNT